MPIRIPRWSPILLCSLLCAGCVPDKPPVVSTIRPPDYLMTCKDAPAVPAGPVTSEALARYLDDLSAAWEDCADHLEDVRRWSKGVKP